MKFPDSRIEVPPPFASEHIALVIKVAASKAPYTVVTGYYLLVTGDSLGVNSETQRE